MRLILILLLLMVFAMSYAIVEETADLRDFLYGNTTACDYDNWISHVSEGIASENYNLYAPWDVQTNGFGDFLIANDSLLSIWEGIFAFFLNEEFQQAQIAIDEAEFPYEIVQFNDTDTGITYYLLRELLNMDYFDDNGTASTHDDEIGSFDFGWGLYVYNPLAANPIIITVPHPNDDFIAPVMSLGALKKWDARFLMINGAGREVKWTEMGGYTNSKSLSDPSRIEDHALTKAYQAACNQIRNEFGRREFSAQIHSYDWNRHDGYPDCQISGGSGISNPNLPIRDLSDLHDDVINQSNHLMWEANSIGTHTEVYLNDYYSVYYSLYEFFFYDDFGRHYPVNNAVDLPGYGGNRQMIYTHQNWNHYDVFEPFFHLEMDELPNAYEETEEMYYWFYGYDEVLQQFDFEQLFVNMIEYYSPWIDAMTAALQNAIVLDDGLIPNPPQNVVIESQTPTSVSLNWEAVSCYDLYSYEIMYADDTITPGHYISITRAENYTLANPRKTSIIIDDLELNTEYFFRIRVLDYAGNISDETPEISTITAPAQISNQIAVGKDGEAVLHWLAEEQDGNLGFNIYQVLEDELLVIDSWQTNPDLAGSNTPNIDYEYQILNLENGAQYTYQLSCQNELGMEFFFPTVMSCQPDEIYHLIIANSDGSIQDTLNFGTNYFASTNFDPYYDILKEFSFPPDYLIGSFWEPNWGQNGMHLQQEIHSQFNSKFYSRSWLLQVITNQFYEPLTISLDDSFPMNYENIYLENPQTNQIVNLTNDDFYFQNQDEEPKEFNLIWGNYGPSGTVSLEGNKIYRAGSTIDIGWNLTNSHLVEYLSLYLVNEEEELQIISHLPASLNHYQWLVPDDQIMHNAKVKLQIHDLEGTIRQRSSFAKTGIISTVMAISGNEGWQMVANPWIGEAPYFVEAVFGHDAQLLIPEQNNIFVETELFEFGQGYWLYSPDGYDYSEDNAVSLVSEDIAMQPGWNLLPNPHFCDYNLGQLRFIYNGDMRTFGSIVSMGVVSENVYSYLEGQYQKTENIAAGGAAYFYVTMPAEDNLLCRFTPYSNSSMPFPLPKDWQIDISATQADTDHLKLGTSPQASEEYDFRFDFPQPPAKPFAESIEIFTNTYAQNSFPFRKLQQNFKSSLEATLSDTVFWNFELSLPNQDAVTLKLDLTSLPENHYVSIYLDGNSWCNLVNNVYIYSFSPSQSGNLSGIVEVRVDPSLAGSNLDLVNSLSCFPNPFNPVTNISFQLVEKANVKMEVYNVKGQRVKILLNSVLPAGVHQITWQGDDQFGRRAASGIYLIRLKTDRNTKTLKTLMLK